MELRDRIKPFVIVDYAEGAALHLYSVEDYKQEIFDTRKADGFTGNGYDWTTLAELFITAEMPNLSNDIQFDPDYSMFTVYADDVLLLEAFAVKFKAALDNDDYIYPFFRRVPPISQVNVEKPPNHLVSVSALIADNENNIFVLQNSNSKWIFPNGTVESGEDLSDALKRIAYDFCGIGIEIKGLYDLSKNVDNDTVHITFLCRCICGTPIINEPIINFCKLNLDDAIKLVKCSTSKSSPAVFNGLI